MLVVPLGGLELEPPEVRLRFFASAVINLFPIARRVLKLVT